MRAYPTWKLTYMAGNEVYFYPKAELGVPEFVKFVDLVQTDPGCPIRPLTHFEYDDRNFYTY